MKEKVIVDFIEETSFEDGSYLIQYSINDRYGYEIEYKMSNKAEKKEEYNNKVTKLRLTSKILIENCSNKLKKLIIGCLDSDNDMLFIEYDDLIEFIESDKSDIQEIELRKLEEEVFKKELNKYIEFGEDAVVTVYGGIITKVLF